MLDTITTSPQTDSAELAELKSRLKHVDIYLDIALPRAYEEDARGNLELNQYISKCGTRGCVGFHYAIAVGKPLTMKDKYETETARALAEQMFGSLPTDFYLQIIEPHGACFAPSVVSLNERKDLMTAYRAELVCDIAALS